MRRHAWIAHPGTDPERPETRRRRNAGIRPSALRSAQWALLMLLGLAPMTVLARQADAPENGSPQEEIQQEAAPAGATDAGEVQAPSENTRSQTDEGQGQSERPPDASDDTPVPSDDADESDAAQPEDQGPKVISGMSILGNQEAPTSLVIVPWKSSQIGDSVGISTVLDDSRQPVDREVFLRALRYYQIRSETKP